MLLVHLALHVPAVGLLVLGRILQTSTVSSVATTLGAVILVVNVAAALLVVRTLLLS